MELHQVRYFLAVANTLNFTRAAEQCNVTQPALTKGMQKLEQELGGELIHRERHLTQLTDLGKGVLPMFERTLASADAVCGMARQFRRKEIAPLVIGLGTSISVSVLLEPIAEIAKFVPGLHVEFREEASHKLVDQLLSGEISAALTGQMSDLPERIDSWLLFEERYVGLISPSHQLAGRKTITVNDLKASNVLKRLECDMSAEFTQNPMNEDLPQVSHGSKNDNHLQEMAAAGFGILLAPEHMPRLASLKMVPIEGDPIRRCIHLLAVQGRRYSPALDAFVKISRLRDWDLAAHANKAEEARHCEFRTAASA